MAKSSSGSKGEESKAKDVDIDQAKLQVAWRYNNLLESKGNAGEIQSKPNQAMGKNFPVTYKFDNSKPMGSTIHNCPEQALKKDEFMSFIEFENESNDSKQTPLQMVWEKIVD